MKRYLISFILVLFLILGFTTVANATEEMTGYDNYIIYNDVTYYIFNADDGFAYMTNPDLDYYMIYGYHKTVDVPTTITIPETYNNMPVKEIWDAAFKNSSFQEIIIPNSITKIKNEAFFGSAITTITIPESVTTIGDAVFAYTSNLKEVVIPDTVLEIGCEKFLNSAVENVTLGTGVKSLAYYDFGGCDNLKSLTIKGKIEKVEYGAFLGATLDGSLVLPDSLTKIEDQAFENSKIKKLVFSNGENSIELGMSVFMSAVMDELVIGTCFKTIPSDFLSSSATVDTLIINEGVEEIADRAFRFCSFGEVSFPSTLKKIGNNAFGVTAFRNPENMSERTDIILPEGLTTIADNAFEAATFKKISLPSTVKDMGDNIFLNARFEEIDIPSTMTVIPQNFLNGIYTLKTVNFKGNVTRIEDGAFAGLEYLENFVLPNGLEYIGNNAFYNSSISGDLVIPSTVKYIGENAFRAREYNSYSKESSYLTSVTIDANISILEFSAFANQVFMKEVKLSDTIEYINENAFANCLSLEKIDVPSKVTVLSTNVFANCINLKTVNLPDGLTIINSGAFNQCTSLEKITIPVSVTTIDENAFSNCTNFTTICGTKGSYAETFAKENNLIFEEVATITNVETKEATNENGEKVTVMPITKNNTIEDFLSEENFPVLADETNEVVILDADGNKKDISEGIGSKNVIQITNKDGDVIAEYTVIVPGDVTGEGKARIFDAFEILKDSIITSEYSEIDTLIRDYDGDGRVRIFDAFEYLRDSIL